MLVYMHVFILTFVPIAGIPGTSLGRTYPVGANLITLWVFLVASSRGNRFASYPIGIDLILSGFRDNFVEWFAHSALRLGYPIGTCLIPFGFCDSPATRLIVLQFSIYYFYLCVHVY